MLVLESQQVFEPTGFVESVAGLAVLAVVVLIVWLVLARLRDR